MLDVIAHATHEHVDDVATKSALEQFLDKEWYIVLPVYLIALAGVGLIVYYVSKKSWSAVYFVWLSIFLLVGLLGYSMSPILSIVSITGGFILAFVTIFGGALLLKK